MPTAPVTIVFIGNDAATANRITKLMTQVDDLELLVVTEQQNALEIIRNTPSSSLLIDSSSLAHEQIINLLHACTDDYPAIVLVSDTNQTDATQFFLAGAHDFLTLEHITPYVLRQTTRFAIERNKHTNIRRLQSAALNAAANAIIITNQNGEILWANPAFSALTGYKLAEVTGQNPRILKSGVQDDSFYADLWKTIKAGNVWHGEIVNRDKNGQFYREEQTITPVLNSAGQVTHFIGIKQNITARKRIEDEVNKERLLLAQRVNERTVELRATNAKLLEALKVKDEFLAAMSHELRTPLNAILGMAELLRENIYGELNPKQAKSIQIIEESGHHLLDLISDVLDLAKIEAGQLDLETSTISITQVCQASLSFVTEMAHKKQIALRLNCPTANHTMVADERRLKQILINLLTNAVKFTPEAGRVGLDVTLKPADHAVEFTVWDTGIGIKPDHIPQLTKPFVQLESGLNRQFEGTGLGLSLVKMLTTMHRGTLGIESQPGHGSRFTVTLPWTPTP